MYCPRCGQEQVSGDTRFCSRCGFLMIGVAELIAGGGNLPYMTTTPGSRNTPRKRGLKQGLFIFLLSFLVVPLLTIVTVAVRAEPFAVIIAMILLVVGGLLRAAYALMFESNDPADKTLEEGAIETARGFLGRGQANALPPVQSIPVSAYAPPQHGRWRETNDLVDPPSVTDHTTRSLQKDQS